MATRHEKFIEQQRKRAAEIRSSALSGTLKSSTPVQTESLTSRADKFRQRQAELAANSAGTPGTPMPELLKRTGILIGDPRQSEAARAVRNEPMAVQQYKQATGVDLSQTAKKEEKSKFAKAIDGFNAFTDRAMSATTFGGSDLINDLFIKIGPKSYSDQLKENKERAENVKGGVVADVIGSLLPGELTYRAGSALVNPLIKNAPKAVQALTRGAAGGALFQSGVEAGEMANGEKESLSGRAKDIALAAGIGGAGDLALTGLGSALSKVFRRNNLPEETITEVLALPEGRGTIRQSAAEARSNLASSADPIINPSDFTPEPLALPQGNTVGPTIARRRTGPVNTYRQKFESLISEAQKREFTPGREDIELENLWSQMADRNDPGLDDLINLAYPSRSTTTPQRGMVGEARNLQNQREVYGIGNPVRSAADRNPVQVVSPAAAPQTVAGRAGGTPRAEFSAPPETPIGTPQRAAQPISREQEMMNKEFLTQDDIDYIMSGQFDQTKLSPEVSSISRIEPEVRTHPPLAAAAPEVNAQPQQQDMFTDLFGDQGLGISAGGSTSRVGTGPVDTADQIVSRGIKNDRQGIKQSASAQARATYQNLVDNLDPLKRISRDTYESAMDATRANNLANTVVRDKFVNLEGEVIGSSLNDIFKKVARGQDKNFIDYLTLRHAKTRMSRGERVYAENLNMTPDKVQQRIDMLNQRYPGFEEIAQEWDKFNDNVLREIGVKEGLISNELYNALRQKNPNYSPMRRQFLRSEKPGKSFIQKSTKSSFSGQKAPIREVSPTGSVRNIVDPRKSTIESVGAWTNAALRNRTMQSMVDAIKRDPEAFRGVAEIIQQPKSKVDLQDVLTSGGQDDFLEALDADFKDLFSTAKVDGDNVVRAMVNGEPVYIKVEDPEIVKTLIGMGPQASNILIDTMSAFSNATKRGATGLLAPAFAIKGATMDLAQSAIQSKNPPKQIAYTVYSIFSGIGDSLNIPGLRNWAQEYRRAGGGYTAALKGDRALNKSISSMTRDPILSPKGVGKGVVRALKAPIDILEGIGNIAENAPRIAASRIEREILGNQITPENIRKAMNAGREVTVNFSRRGALTRDIESFVPYNNAAVQGTYRVLRSFKKNPVRTVAAIGTLAVLPKLYEYSKFADDPDYQNLPARERYRFLIVNKNEDGTFTKIPMEPAYNSFGEATIEALRYFQDSDPTAFKGALDALANAWTPPLVTGALQGITKGDGAEGSISGVINSTVAAPFYAVGANKSFTGAPIVSQSLEDRSKPYQYDERTSSIAKTLGQTLDMSPQKVDYLIKAYGGDLARLVLPLTSDLGQGNARNTVLKNFIVDPEFSNTLTDDFYAAKDKLNQAYADYNEAGAELPSWYNEELRKALNSTAKGSVSKQLSGLRDYKKQITADKSMTDKQRTEQLREIQQQINEIYINVNSVLQESGVIQ